MSNRPPNWYQMDPEEQRVWRNVETERENLEYNMRRQQEDSEREARRLKDSADHHRLEHEAARDQVTELRDDNAFLSDRLELAEEYIRTRAEWDLFVAWRKDRVGCREDEGS